MYSLDTNLPPQPKKKDREGDIYAFISDSGRTQKKEVSFKLCLKMKNE